MTKTGLVTLGLAALFVGLPFALLAVFAGGNLRQFVAMFLFFTALGYPLLGVFTGRSDACREERAGYIKAHHRWDNRGVGGHS